MSFEYRDGYEKRLHHHTGHHKLRIKATPAVAELQEFGVIEIDQADPFCISQLDVAKFAVWSVGVV